MVDLLAFFHILIVLLSFKPNIVHTHGAKSGLFGRLAAYLSRVPVIIHTFHGHLFHSYFSSRVSSIIKLLERGLAKITDGFIILSPSQLVDLVNTFKILPVQKCRIIPLGLQVPTDNNGEVYRNQFRKTYNLANTDVAIGIVGRIVPIKNHQFYIEVIQKILSLYPNNPPAFFIIGDGELRGEVEQYLTSMSIKFSNSGIQPAIRVVFTSWLADIKPVMHGLDVIALTSLNEGTPLSLIEGQAFCKPIIATNVGGVKDTMVNYETGFCIENGQLQDYCDKLQLLIDNAELRKSMGLAGQKFVEQKFLKSKEVESTKDFYISLLARRQAVQSN